jgi:hypothetical protein
LLENGALFHHKADLLDHSTGSRPASLTPSFVETTKAFEGLYHVLHGAISPLRGIGPEQYQFAVGVFSR